MPCRLISEHNTASATVNSMKLLSTTVYTTLFFALANAVHLGPLKTTVKVGVVKPLQPPYTPEEEHAANNVIGLLEYVRRLMPVGIDMFLKVTEPYTKDVLPEVVLSPETGAVEGKVTLSNLVASGAQQFTIHSIGVGLESERLDFNVSVPEVVVDVDYLGINLTLYDILVFNTSGHVHLTLSGLDVIGAFGVEEPYGVMDPRYQVTGIEVVNSVDDVEVNSHGPIDEVIVEQIKNAVMNSVAEAAIDEIDAVLSHFTVKQVKAFLLG